MTTKANEVSNRAWLIGNDLEMEYDLWRAVNNADDDETSLQFFKNDVEKSEQLKKMVKPFSYSQLGFFVCWNSDAGLCSVFNPQYREAATLFADLKSKKDAELYSWADGVLKRIA